MLTSEAEAFDLSVETCPFECCVLQRELLWDWTFVSLSLQTEEKQLDGEETKEMESKATEVKFPLHQ